MEKRAPSTWIEVDKDGVGWEVTETYATYSSVYDQHDRVTRVQLPIVICNYSCLICGHPEYKPIYQEQNRTLSNSSYLGPPIYGPARNNGSSKESVRVIVGYCCPGCSIGLFTDPRKFSKNQPPSIAPMIATKRPESEALLQLAAIAKGLGITSD